MSQIQYFLGGNTPSGFYSLYDYLSHGAGLNTLYILKGGPGSGKSSLMRRVDRHAKAAGLKSIFILCSGDPNSLDGVILPQLGVAVVDGTAPHVMEPECAGVVEQYVDLSRFYDRAGLQPHKEQIQAASSEYRDHYRRAYRCLGAVGELRRGNDDLLAGFLPRQKLEKRAKGIIGREIKGKSTGAGGCARLFLSALTHKGRLTLWDTVSAQADRVYELSDSLGFSPLLLTPIARAAEAAGQQVILCPDPLDPDRPAHLILPELSLAFVTSTPEHPWPHRPYRRLRLDAAVDSEALRACRPRLRFANRVMTSLTEEAVEELSRAKRAHDRLEEFYNPYVDFKGVYETADGLADEILSSS